MAGDDGIETLPRSFDTPLPIDAVLDELARTLAGSNAAVLDALAWTDGTPAPINAGRLTNEPPPANAFITPARKPAPATIANLSIPVTIKTVATV